MPGFFNKVKKVFQAIRSGISKGKKFFDSKVLPFITKSPIVKAVESFTHIPISAIGEGISMGAGILSKGNANDIANAGFYAGKNAISTYKKSRNINDVLNRVGKQTFYTDPGDIGESDTQRMNRVLERVGKEK